MDARSEPKSAASSSRSLRVLHVHSGNIYGGVEVALASIARLAPARGIDPEFALCFEGRQADELRAAGVPVHVLGAVRTRYPWQVLRARRQLRAVLEGTAYDAVTVHNSWSLACFARTIRARGVPLVFHLHGAFEKDAKLAMVDRLAQRWRPDFVICNSAYSEGTLSRLFVGVPHAVVYTPMEVRRPAATARASVRRELDVRDDEVVILQASRLDAWKGHRLHLESLARVETRTPWRAWFAGGPQGEGQQRVFDDLVAYARALGLGDRVRFLGQRADVPELMAAADVLCQPNTAPEPFGLVFIEALTAGRPIVTSAMGGALEIVDATCGFLVPPEAGAVANALTKLVEDDALRASMRGPATRRAAEVCDPDRQMRAMREAIGSASRAARSR